ncbi:MAG: hypothetical protein KGQ59_00830, partial [Bdellovibrionales bacterium]|nr:hypothetical protein [Bdellovibrionales bacterium]
FFAPKVSGSEKPTFLVRFETEKGCEFCSEALPSLKRLLETRLSSRGVSFSWPKDSEVLAQPVPTKSKSLFPALSQLQVLQSVRQLDGSVVLRVERATRKDDESGLEIEPQERRYRIIFGLATGKYTEIRSVEVGPTDSTEASSKRLFLEAMSSLGAKVQESETRLASRPTGQNNPEVLLKVAGVRDYFSLAQLKSQVQLALGELEPVSERRLGKGISVLAVSSRLKPSELKVKLNGLAVGAGKLVVNEVLEGESVIEVEADIR